MLKLGNVNEKKRKSGLETKKELKVEMRSVREC